MVWYSATLEARRHEGLAHAQGMFMPLCTYAWYYNAHNMQEEIEGAGVDFMLMLPTTRGESIMHEGDERQSMWPRSTVPGENLKGVCNIDLTADRSTKFRRVDGTPPSF